jgi:hypothetical protein
LYQQPVWREMGFWEMTMVSVRSRHNPVVVWGQWFIWREDNEGRTKRTGEQWNLHIHFILQTWTHRVCHSKTKSSMQFLLHHQINLFKSIGALQSHLSTPGQKCMQKQWVDEAVL